MDDPKLKKSQVSLEFILGFIAILLLFVGSFNIWLGVNNSFVTENKDYQSQRLASGQGNITIPSLPGVPGTIPNVDDETMQKIIKILTCGCCCISSCGTPQEEQLCISDATKQRAVDLYTQQYKLKIQIDTYTEVAKGLTQSLASLRAGYNAIPWCSDCCECQIACGGVCTQYCQGSDDSYCCAWSPNYIWQSCGGSLSNQCVSCPVWSGWWCPGDDSDSGPSGTCVGIRKHAGEQHTIWRQQIQDGIDTTQTKFDENQALLDKAIADKIIVDNQIQAIQPDLVCCGV